MRRLLLLSAALGTALLGPAAGRARAALLSAQSVAVLGSDGSARASFSSNETIGFAQTVFNGVAGVGRTAFQFEVLAPNGNVSFRHTGNSVPGTVVGNASARIAGIAVSGLYQGPGNYTLRATASLDGTSVVQTQQFTVSSPNILLIYPPNGSTGLSDNPLTFQWFSSGASSYRISVGDNPSVYNPILVQNTGALASFTYPQNPADDRQKLAAGQVYYWQIEGLDSNGNVVAASQVPYSFGVATVSLTKDLAVKALDVNGSPDSAGNIPFVITVKNQGTTTETGIPLKFTVGGLPAPGTPIDLPPMLPGDEKSYTVTASIPSDQAQGLAIACLTIFDDTVANNCKTLTVSRPTTGTGTGGTPGSAQLTAEQIWEAIKQLLKEQGMDLTDYDLVGMEGSFTREELAALLDQLRNGSSKVVVTGPPLTTPPPAASGTTSPAPYVPVAKVGEAPPLPPEEETKEDGSTEWSGYSAPLASKTTTLTISDEARFKKLWTRLSDQPAPAVDFRRSKVVAVLIGKGQKVDRVSVEGMSPDGDALVVRFRLIRLSRLGRGNAPDLRDLGTRYSPYLLKAVPRDAASVRFEQIKEDE